MTPVPARLALLQFHALLAMCSVVIPLEAQAPGSDAVASYYNAVGEYFRVPSSEIMILSEWRLAAEEIPVVLYTAGQGGISPEAVMALRRAGQDWPVVACRYGLDAVSFHVPLEGNSGPLARVYQAYRSRPQAEWSTIDLLNEDIVGLVNLRVLSGVFQISPGVVLQARDRAGSWVGAYRTLARR
jgi:hypothetical protein